MPDPFRAGLLAAALAIPFAAAAQEAPPKEDAQIVVTGTRNTGSEIADFVDAFIVVPPGGQQLSRFEWAVCPMASGVAPAQKQAVAARIRAVAKAANIRVGGKKCAPNVLVLVTADRKALIAAMLRLHPDYFDGLTRAEMRYLRESPDPAVAWHLSGAPLTADGAELQYDSRADFFVNRTTLSSSRIGFATRPQFAAAIVVVESRALVGLTTTQLADYAAMRTLIRTDPSRLEKSAAPTILKVLDAPMDSAVPVTLTQWDLGVLRGFYASNPTLSAYAQRSDMRKRLKREVEKPAP
jgi:hypothetical protein